MHLAILAGTVLLALASAGKIPTLSHSSEDYSHLPASNPLPVREPFTFHEEEPASPSRRRDVITPPLTFGQSYPDDLEPEVIGPLTNPIYLNTPAFSGLNTNVRYA